MKKNILIITQKVDINDPVLGFFHQWIVEFSKRVDYPNDSDPNYAEKMDYIKNNTADGSTYMNPSDDVDSYSFNVLQSSKYFAPDAVDAIVRVFPD